MLFSYALIQFSNPIIPFRIVIHFSDFIIPLCILLFSAVSNSILVAFELCYAVFQSCYSIVQSSHAVSNPIISFQILLFSFPILLCSVSNSIIRFRIMFFQIRDFVYLADGALGTSNKLISARV